RAGSYPSLTRAPTAHGRFCSSLFPLPASFRLPMRTLLAFLVLACSTDPTGPVPPPPPPPPPPPAGALRIVILGNSLTYSNSMPTMIAVLAVASSKPRPTVVAHAHGNFAIMDHWENAASTTAMDDAS